MSKATLPTRGVPLVEGNGSATLQFYDWLRSVPSAQVSVDVSALVAQAGTFAARLTALEAATVVAYYGAAGKITVNGAKISIASNYLGQTSITTLGVIEFGTWNGVAIAAPFGGTGQTSYTAGDILYASDTDELSKLAAGTSGYVLTSNGPGVAPSYQATAPSAPPTTMTANYTVASNTQVLFTLPIEVGTFDLDIVGDLIEVA